MLPSVEGGMSVDPLAVVFDGRGVMYSSSSLLSSFPVPGEDGLVSMGWVFPSDRTTEVSTC